MLHSAVLVCLWVSYALAQTNFSLYAYSADTRGLPIVYMNGKNQNVSDMISLNNADTAYLYNGSWTGDSSSASNISFAFTGESGRVLSASPNATSNTNSTGLSGQRYLYILPDQDVAEVGFANSTSDAPSGSATDGFLLFGKQLMYASNGDLLAQFWAQSIVPGLWSVTWNSASQQLNGSFPVAIKSTPPTPAGRRN